jgi:lipoprotein-anchoring transpeptidase ErfK/SrfK
MRRHVAELKQALLAILLLISVQSFAQQAQQQREIVVSIQDRKLALMENGQLLRIYDVAVGAATSPSPTGTFSITNRLENPTYYHPGVVIEPGPNNPLGTRWIGLTVKGFGIHGTNVPSSIGKAASHGCIRMGRADLEELFTMVRAGDTVRILAEQDDQVARMFNPQEDQPMVAAQTLTPEQSSLNEDASTSR